MVDPTMSYTARDSIFKELQTVYSQNFDYECFALRFGQLLSIVVAIHVSSFSQMSLGCDDDYRRSCPFHEHYRLPVDET